MVFIDGQNVFKACERRFGRGQVHPSLIIRTGFLRKLESGS
jgi:hypothetical protein